MALPLKQRRRQQILLIVALVILLVTGGVLYFGFLKKPKPPSQETIPAEALPGPVTEQASSLLLDEKLRRINKLDFEFLNEKILSFLKIHGNLPVQKGATGREDPFIPY